MRANHGQTLLETCSTHLGCIAFGHGAHVPFLARQGKVAKIALPGGATRGAGFSGGAGGRGGVGSGYFP
jgi:hypothetical protein